MGHDKINIVKELPHLRPQFLESRLLLHVVPGDTVNIGEFKIFIGRFDEERLLRNDLLIRDPDESNRACAVGIAVSGFKVDGEEGHIEGRIQKIGLRMKNPRLRGFFSTMELRAFHLPVLLIIVLFLFLFVRMASGAVAVIHDAAGWIQLIERCLQPPACGLGSKIGTVCIDLLLFERCTAHIE